MTLGIHTVEFVGRDDIGGGALALRFAVRRPLKYAAGQHALWQIPGGGVAPFTIASAPEEPNLALATNGGAHSHLKRALGGMQPGARVRLVGPLSSFTLADAGDDVVMLAQGIGITPFRAMLTHVALTGAVVRSSLIHVGAAEGSGHPYRADTESAATAAAYPGGRREFAVHLAGACAAWPDATYMIAGSRSFVATTAATLNDYGITADRIRRDTFYGWSGARARTTAA